MQIKFPEISKQQLPTLDSVSAKFHSAKNAIADKFQSNNWLNGQSLLEFAEENKVELGAAAAATVVGGLAIYTLPSAVNPGNGTVANKTLTINITNNGTVSFNGTSYDFTDFSEWTSAGTVAAFGVAAAIILLASKCLCCPSQRCKTQAQKEKEAAAAKIQENREAVINQYRLDNARNQTVENLLNPTTGTEKDNTNAQEVVNSIKTALGNLGLVSRTPATRAEFRERVLLALDTKTSSPDAIKVLETLNLLPAFTQIANKFASLVHNGLDQNEANGHLAALFFDGVADIGGAAKTNAQIAGEFAQAVIAYQAKKTALSTAGGVGENKVSEGGAAAPTRETSVTQLANTLGVELQPVTIANAPESPRLKASNNTQLSHFSSEGEGITTRLLLTRE